MRWRIISETGLVWTGRHWASPDTDYTHAEAPGCLLVPKKGGGYAVCIQDEGGPVDGVITYINTYNKPVAWATQREDD